MSDVFLSYASDDRERIMPLVQALEATRWSIFWDRTIPVGKTWRQVIGKEIHDARSIVVVWSNKSVESDWVQEEAEEGKRRGILFPVQIDAVLPPFGFGAIQAADLNAWDGSADAAVIRRLVADLSLVLGDAPAEAARQEAEEEARRREQEEAIHKAEEEAQREKEELEREEERLRENREAEERRRAEQKRKAEDEQQRMRQEQARLDAKKSRQEEEAKRKAEEADKRRRAEANQRATAEKVAQQAEKLRRLKAAKQKHRAAVAEPEPKAEEEVRPKAEDERRRKKRNITLIASTLVILVSILGVWILYPTGDSLESMPAKSSSTYPEPEMVVIPAGSFLMGGSVADEQPRHRVNVSKFTMGKYPVTFDEYDEFARSTGRTLPGDEGWGRGNRPVIMVSWDDAQAYIEWLSKRTGKQYRLPSEAEWEYAARAETKWKYWWGDGINQDGEVWANCDGCGSQWDGEQTAPVGSFEANDFGLYDTAGNVWEWNEDCWHENYLNAPVDGSAWLEVDDGNCARRVIRGGSWDVKPDVLRSANRYRSYRLNANDYVGFRLAQDLE